jgi:hypothetical protein
MLPNSVWAQDCTQLFQSYKDWLLKKPKGPGYKHFLGITAVSNSSLQLVTYVTGTIDEPGRTSGLIVSLPGKGIMYKDKPYWDCPSRENGFSIPDLPFDPKGAKNVDLKINFYQKTFTIGDSTIINLRCEKGLLYGFKEVTTGGLQPVPPMYIISIRKNYLEIPH